jgi:hypothetical protein
MKTKMEKMLANVVPGAGKGAMYEKMAKPVENASASPAWTRGCSFWGTLWGCTPVIECLGLKNGQKWMASQSIGGFIGRCIL